MIKKIEREVSELRLVKPLVLNLTNYVTMDFMANVLLALGVAPIMSVCEGELEELIKISSSININIGTLDDSFINRCFKAAAMAKHYQVPVVLDPVGSGASRIRTHAARDLIHYADIVRGNASEIISLEEDSSKNLGVESRNSVDEAKDKAIQLAKRHGCTVVVSGPVDFITDGTRKAFVKYGSSLMPTITGTGCALTAVISAFRGACEDSFISSWVATSYFGLCGQIGGLVAKGPGTFRVSFIDALYTADFSKMREFYVE